MYLLSLSGNRQHPLSIPTALMFVLDAFRRSPSSVHIPNATSFNVVADHQCGSLLNDECLSSKQVPPGTIVVVQISTSISCILFWWTRDYISPETMTMVHFVWFRRYVVEKWLSPYSSHILYGQIYCRLSCLLMTMLSLIWLQSTPSGWFGGGHGISDGDPLWTTMNFVFWLCFPNPFSSALLSQFHFGVSFHILTTPFLSFKTKHFRFLPSVHTFARTFDSAPSIYFEVEQSSATDQGTFIVNLRGSIRTGDEFKGDCFSAMVIQWDF